MCIGKIRLFHRKYRKRCRNFYSGSIAGLFTGIAIGIFFTLITDVKFNRWINLASYELFVAIIYFLFVFFVLVVLYFLGKLLVWFLVTKSKDELIGFRINYFASIYSASFTASLIILHDNLFIASIVTLAFIVLYFPVEYFSVRNKK